MTKINDEKRNRLIVHFNNLVILNETTESLIDNVLGNDVNERKTLLKNNSVCIDRLKRIIYKLQSIKF